MSQDEEYVSFLLKLIKHLETGDINEYLKMGRFTHADVLEKRILNGLSLSGDRPQSIPFLNIETNRIKIFFINMLLLIFVMSEENIQMEEPLKLDLHSLIS